MRLLLKIKRRLKRYYFQKLALFEVRKIYKAYLFILKKNEWMALEKKELKKVTQLRNDYLNSEEILSYKDFGAGSPEDSRSSDEMKTGVTIDRSVAEICQVAASPENWGEYLFKLIRELKPKTILELGTNLGISAAYQLSALKLNGQGELISLEGADSVAETAEHTLSDLGYTKFKIYKGRFLDTLPGILNSNTAIDFAFIDGHHDKTATLEYFELIYPSLSSRSVVVFDDINWSQGMKDFWTIIKMDSRMHFIFDLEKWGVVVIDKSKTNKKPVCIKRSL